MLNIKKLVRSNILDLQPYSSARDEFSGREGVFLDANENPYGEFNRYPDPYQKELKQKLAVQKGVDIDTIFVGNGSDEVIDLAFRVFCDPGMDKALTFTPTYGMYDVSAAINNVKLLKIPLNKEFQIDRTTLDHKRDDKSIKLVFICSPNNPTGNLMNQRDIEFILENFNSIVIIDEAYIDFAEGDSLINLIDKYSNLIVCQTFSKAWGLAAARVGMAYSNSEIISLLNKIKPPYNVSKLNQNLAVQALENKALYKAHLKRILSEKIKLKNALDKLDVVKKIYPSDANFFLIEVTNAEAVYAALVAQDIIIRKRTKLVPNGLRITVGTAQENQSLITALKNIS
ncbi:MAG: histidinol-phosphate transaminase [Flavobacteriaceae bacterium]|nr:histidinol-phosphate transaminase [Flavobacteriaceae bacterium]